MNTTDVRIRVTSGPRRLLRCASLTRGGLPRRGAGRRAECSRQRWFCRQSARCGIRARRPVVGQGRPRGARRAGAEDGRQRARRSRLGRRAAGRRLSADVPGRRPAGHGADRGPRPVHVRDHLLRRHLLRRRPGVDHHERQPARLVDDRCGQLPDGPGHVPGSAERVRPSAPRRPGRSTTGRSSTRAARADPRAARAAAASRGAAPAASNLNWDGAWQVQTDISDIGWSAEFAIPFTTVRYPAREFQSWGVNFQRNIRRRSEISYWAPLPPAVQPVPRVDGGPARRTGHPGRARQQPADDAVRHRRDRRAPRRGRRVGDAGRLRLRGRPEVQHQLGPDPRRHVQHRLRAGRGGRPAESTSIASTCSFPRSGRSSWRTPASSP